MKSSAKGRRRGDEEENAASITRWRQNWLREGGTVLLGSALWEGVCAEVFQRDVFKALKCN